MFSALLPPERLVKLLIVLAGILAGGAVIAAPASAGLIAAISADERDGAVYDPDILLVDPLDPSKVFTLPPGVNNSLSADRASLSGDGRYLAFRLSVVAYFVLDRHSGQMVQIPTPAGATGSAPGAALSPDASRYAFTIFTSSGNATTGSTTSVALVDASAFPAGPFPELGRPAATVNLTGIGGSTIVQAAGQPAVTDAGKVAWAIAGSPGGGAGGSPGGGGGMIVAPPGAPPRLVTFKPPSANNQLLRASSPSFVPTASSPDELTFTFGTQVGQTGDTLGKIRMSTNTSFERLSLPGLALNATGRDERLPTWSPSGRYLAFVEQGPRGGGDEAARESWIKVYDTQTQQLVLPEGRSVGRIGVFEGGPDSLSLAETPSIIGNFTIAGGVTLPQQRAVTLLSNLSITTSVGILVQRITGRRTLFGRRVPKLKKVGRVPLGKRSKGRNRIRWSGKVEGKRLKPGRYQITMRALRNGGVTDLSKPLEVRVQ